MWYVDGCMKKEFYIDYLNKDNNFREARKWFDTEDDAWQWALKNLSNPNRDQIRMKRPPEWVG